MNKKQEFLAGLFPKLMKTIEPLTEIINEIYDTGYNEGYSDRTAELSELDKNTAENMGAAQAAVEQDPPAMALLEGSEVAPTAMDEKDPDDEIPFKKSRIDPINYRHTLAEAGITECGLTGPILVTLEMTTGNRVTCPDCLASIEAKQQADAVQRTL